MKIDRRYELKSYFNLQQFNLIYEFLFKDLMLKKIFHDRKVQNIYFDDSNFTSAFDKIEGNPFRIKRRIRFYDNKKKFFYEKKIKKGDFVYKKTEQLISVQDKINFLKYRNLNPVITNKYIRSYFYSDLFRCRVTIDSNLCHSYYGKNLSFTRKNIKIIEFKIGEENINFLQSKIDLPFRLKKFSKYYDGVYNLYFH